MTTQIQLNAFEVANFELARNQAKVLWAIDYLNKHNIPASDKQIALFLKLEINKITPRRSELEKASRIYGAKVDYDGLSKIKVNLWKIRGAL